jgi:hypothetical protein
MLIDILKLINNRPHAAAESHWNELMNPASSQPIGIKGRISVGNGLASQTVEEPRKHHPISLEKSWRRSM